MDMKRLEKAKRENGAIIIEAIIALTVYMFTIFTVLSIVDICYTQARVSVALNCAARDLSKYSYLYYKMGMSDLQQEIEEASSESREMTNELMNGTGTLISSMVNLKDDAQVENTSEFTEGYFQDLEKDMNAIGNAASGLSSNVQDIASSFSEDPKQFMMGMGMMAADTVGAELRIIMGEAMARAFMQKNLKAYEGDDPDSFLRRHGIEDGMDGLDFSGTTMMGGEDNDIVQLVVTYDIKVIQLLDLDYSFTICQTAKTHAWGVGVSNEASTEKETE